MSRTEPVLIRPDGETANCIALPRVHDQFNEKYIQDLLANHPELLPLSTMRPDVGELICIGREVSTRGSGTIDNLYLSTSGYVVIVETKLWRNPQGRREVVAQVLDYVKDVVTRDFTWFESVWSRFCKERALPTKTLSHAIAGKGDDEFDESDYIDRLHRALERGDIIALIVGDGIETRLQQLVSHLCKDSAHLRYSLGLISLRCYRLGEHNDLLVLPELVQEVEPIERAYVRIELDEAMRDRCTISSVTRDEEEDGGRSKRVTLSESEFYESLENSIGKEDARRIQDFVEALSEAGIEPDFKSAAMMLKVADPNGEGPAASLFAIEKNGRVYNPDHARRRVARWGFGPDALESTVFKYWRAMHAIDNRFSPKGMSHLGSKSFLPLKDVMVKLDAIRDAMTSAVEDIRRESTET